MDGDAYEAWVSGIDPDTGELRGRVRQDEHALRFAEVVVNGPKSWSIAAELHPDIAEAYGAAQERAAVEIVRWLGQHATTRVGPRGGQVSAPVQRIEAVAVAHYTSRAGDPHRHIHLQINARVQAAGQWRGIDSVAVRNAIGAVQGIGHAAVMCDPAFRGALAGHGFTLDTDTGEVVELAGYVEAFSKRAEQISAQVAGYEAQWRAANPHEEAGPALRRAWDARAWAEHRPGKAHVEPGLVLHERWVTELDALGYQPPDRPAPISQQPVGRSTVGQLDRDAAAAEILARLTATRSAWNQADLRGEAEQLLARRSVTDGIITAPEVRAELAEDLTSRAAAAAVPLLSRVDVPTHIRAWTSAEAIAVEADLTGRLAARGSTGSRDAVTGRDVDVETVARAAAAAGARLDPAQAEAAAALAGDHPLVLVTGAAGAGKTTTLAATRAALERDGHQLLVVTPTLKAARGARAETGAHTGTVAWLVYQHGWRQDDAGRWARLQVGDPDPARWAGGRAYPGPRADAWLHAGDLVVVDEAGMLDQDTARALLTVVDEQRARLALVGDAHQLPAIGRGGVLEIAGRWAERACTLDVIHRFVHTVEIEPGVHADVEDTAYAALSLRMRAGAAGDPAAVFDQLAAGDHVRLHPTIEQLRISVATDAAAARRAGANAAVSVATNDQARALNTAIRDQLVASSDVDDGATGNPVAVTSTGQRIGAGDLIATRDNNRDVDVANRDTWTVHTVHPDGSLTITPTTSSGGTVAGSGRVAGDRTLPASYVNRHVELGYAGTIHSVQGETAHTAHLVLDEHTSAAAAYVAMTRGRTTNTVHVLAADLDQARTQWADAAGRGRPDLGIDAARHAAEREAAPYVTAATEGVAGPEQAARVLDALHQAWTEQDRAQAQLKRLEPRLAAARADHARHQDAEQALAPLREAMTEAQAVAEHAARAAAQARAQLDARADQLNRARRTEWDTDLVVAGADARTVQAGTGRLGRGRAAVHEAQQRLDAWAEQWRPVLTELPAGLADPVALSAGWHADRVHAALENYTSWQVAAELPHHVDLMRTATTTKQTAHDARAAYRTAAAAQDHRTTILRAAAGWRGTAEELPRLTDQTTNAQQRLAQAEQQIQQLSADPAITSQPHPEALLTAARTQWTGHQIQADLAALQRTQQRAANEPTHRTDPTRHHGPSTGPNYGPDSGRGGPGFGR